MTSKLKIRRSARNLKINENLNEEENNPTEKKPKIDAEKKGTATQIQNDVRQHDDTKSQMQTGRQNASEDIEFNRWLKLNQADDCDNTPIDPIVQKVVESLEKEQYNFEKAKVCV